MCSFSAHKFYNFINILIIDTILLTVLPFNINLNQFLVQM